MTDAINLIIVAGLLCGVYLVRDEAKYEKVGAFYEAPSVVSKYAAQTEPVDYLALETPIEQHSLKALARHIGGGR